MSNDWTDVTLGEICSPKQWHTIGKEDFSKTGYPVYGANGIIGLYKTYNHAEPVIAVTCRGATCGSISLTKPFSYVTGNSMCLDEIRDDVDIIYLFHLLLFSGFKDAISGSAQPQITRGDISKINILFPPLPEQKKIAEILSGIDNAISIKKQARIDLEATREAICKELIQNRDWHEEKVGDLTTHMTNGFVGTATPHYRERGVRYLTSKNIRRDRIDSRKMIYISEEFHMANQKSSLRVGDILMVQSGHIGTTAVVTDEYKDCNCHALILMRFNQEQLDPHYASLYFNSTTGRTRLSDIFVGSTVKHVNTGDLRKFKIPLPPLGVQKDIANRVNAMDRLLGQRGVQIEKLVILKQAISSDLLSGRKRVSI